MTSFLERISSLPQAACIPRARAENWLAAVLAIEPDRVAWHIERLFGLGGSDIGSVVLHDRCRRGLDVDETPFTDAAAIVQSKLMLMHPTPPEGPTEWGTLLEPVIQRLALRRFGAVQDTDLIDEISRSPFSSSHPWARCNLDDIWILNGKRILVDYKAPGDVSHFFSAGAPTDYRCQLDLYALRLEELGAPADFRCLVVLDPVLRIPRIVYVPADDRLRNEMLAAGDYAWNNYVLKGEVPDPMPQQRAQLLESLPQLEVMGHELAAYKSIADAAEERASLLKAQMKSFAKARGLSPGHATEAGAFKVSSTEKVYHDTPEILMLLRAHEVPLDQFIQDNGAFDAAAGFNHLLGLAAQGVISADISALRRTEPQIIVRAPDPRSKHDRAMLWQTVSEVAKSMVHESGASILGELLGEPDLADQPSAPEPGAHATYDTVTIDDPQQPVPPIVQPDATAR